MSKEEYVVEITSTDVMYLQSFVEEVLATIHNDDVGITYGLEDMALNAGVILGLTKAYMESVE